MGQRGELMVDRDLDPTTLIAPTSPTPCTTVFLGFVNFRRSPAGQQQLPNQAGISMNARNSLWMGGDTHVLRLHTHFIRNMDKLFARYIQSHFYIRGIFFTWVFQT